VRTPAPTAVMIAPAVASQAAGNFAPSSTTKAENEVVLPTREPISIDGAAAHRSRSACSESTITEANSERRVGGSIQEEADITLSADAHRRSDPVRHNSSVSTVPPHNVPTPETGIQPAQSAIVQPAPPPTPITQSMGRGLDAELIAILERVGAEIDWDDPNAYKGAVAMEFCHTVEDLFEQIDDQAEGRTVKAVTIDHIDPEGGGRTRGCRILRASKSAVANYRIMLGRLKLLSATTDPAMKIKVEWS